MTRPVDLLDWLEYLEGLHPREIDLGLDRIERVAARLGINKPAPLVVTVGGTNGKGSCVALLDVILREAGYRTGCYTSPHLWRYNERVAIQGDAVTDAALCRCFEQIEEQRAEISLTYFEFGTLAALLLFQEAALDVAVLEVGLGGRLDAVNIVDADIAILASIGIDHQQWLGSSRESIAFEKAGIFRAEQIALCGDADVPEAVTHQAQALHSRLYCQGKHYGVAAVSRESDPRWDWWGSAADGSRSERSGLPLPLLDLRNAATVIQALVLSPLKVSAQAIADGLRKASLSGRFQQLTEPVKKRRVILDVAHNPQAARLLADKLQEQKVCGRIGGRIHLILAMMADKDHTGFHRALESVVDIWYIAAFAQPRCLDARMLYNALPGSSGQSGKQSGKKGPYTEVAEAFEAARSAAGPEDLIVATGSFFTVLDSLLVIEKGPAGQ